jgi:hypothetical protein
MKWTKPEAEVQPSRWKSLLTSRRSKVVLI